MTTPTVEEEFIEAGASLEHARWARWQEHMHSKFVEHENGKGKWVCLPADLFRRWERQIGTEYASLSEEEKESDRKEVREYLPLLRAYGNARYEEGVKAEATRRDGIEHAIEQSIIDQHVTNERNRITQWAMEVLPFYPEAQKALIEFLSDNE